MYSSKSKIDKKVVLILAAAGIGKRMGLNYPKQFFEYKGKPLFLYPLEVAQNSKIIDEIIVVTNGENVDIVKNLCQKYNISKVKSVIKGGDERQNSVYNGICAIDSCDIVLVQDGVRPFLKEKYIEECCRVVVEENSGAVVGVPVKDTIKMIDDTNSITNTPTRKNLIAVHTPQVFSYDILKRAYEKAMNDNFLGTDDSSLVERMGEKVKIVIGDYDNVKITTPEDLSMLK